MAKYTLNLSEICEQVSGLKFEDLDGLPFDRIDDICNAAIPNIFSTRYDLLDNGEDLNELQRKILEHYWEYEVCTYTPSDFILRLNRKLNEIAPLYNQRYESTKLEYPIFEDIKVKEEGKDTSVNTGDSTSSSNTKHSDQDIHTQSHTGDVTNRMDEDGSTIASGNNTNTQGHTGTVGIQSQESGTTKIVDVLDGEQKHSGTLGVQNQESGTTKTVTDRTEEDKGHDATLAQKHITNDGVESSENKKTDWTYNNDTPQGSISGVADQDYLTSYSKHTSEHDENPFNYQGHIGGTFFDGSSFELNSDDTKIQRADNLNVTMGLKIDDQKQHTAGKTEIDDTATVTHGKGDTSTTTYGDKVETDNTDTSTTTHGKGDKSTTTYGDTIATDGTHQDITLHGKGQTDKTVYGDTINNVTAYGQNIKTDAEQSNKNNHIGNYEKYIEGKQNSGKSYMEMLAEYRMTMINIYDEIIKELRELFFIIY